jgi:hypothetical protein
VKVIREEGGAQEELDARGISKDNLNTYLSLFQSRETQTSNQQ